MAAKLRHGFKAEANRWARDLRIELKLELESPLSPWKLADFLGVNICPLGNFLATNPEEVAVLRKATGHKGFSAVTYWHNGTRRILHNDGHRELRQASDIAHELAHALLMHPPLKFGDGERNVDVEQEMEANWLGPALLISEEAALFIVRRGLTLDEAVEYYGASREVIQMRINASGARKRSVA